jgi:hypothetical protein
LKLGLGCIIRQRLPGRSARTSNHDARQTSAGGDLEGVYSRGNAAFKASVPQQGRSRDYALGDGRESKVE